MSEPAAPQPAPAEPSEAGPSEADAPIVLVEIAERTATITLNRPHQRNSLSSALIRELRQVVRAVEADDGVDVIVLTGADPAFCAGLDLKELGAGGSALADTGATGESTRGERGALPACTKPVIGAVNGAAITGGFELALACDFLVASERARFADTHARVGIQPGWGLTVLLPQAIGLRRAREMSATGNFLDAPTALAWGLVNHVVPHDDLLRFAHGLAADIASNDQLGVRRIFATYDEGSLAAGGDAWEVEARVAGEWQGEGIDPAEIERRRQQIVDRGRSQL
ncbi:MAG: putative enoyl-CoA hydratase [Acidimicrobiales bacterium]|nr:putative enoyl-CoA hydratase [Acidimicrobiales bacterium]